jgi:hypothetical protein
VIVQAHIGTNGDVENLRIVFGDPALAAAAIDMIEVVTEEMHGSD